MNLDRLATTIEHDRRAARQERARTSPDTSPDATGRQPIPPASPSGTVSDQAY